MPPSVQDSKYLLATQEAGAGVRDCRSTAPKFGQGNNSPPKLVTGIAEVLQTDFVVKIFVLSVGIGKRPMQTLGGAEEHRANLFGTEGDHQIDRRRVDRIDALG